MGDADDCRVDHVGMVEQHVFDLDAVHVLARANDHVLRAVDQIEKAVGIEVSDVAGVEPAVGERGRVRVGPAPIPVRHDGRTLDPDLAALTGSGVATLLVDNP